MHGKQRLRRLESSVVEAFRAKSHTLRLEGLLHRFDHVFDTDPRIEIADSTRGFWPKFERERGACCVNTDWA